MLQPVDSPSPGMTGDGISRSSAGILGRYAAATVVAVTSEVTVVRELSVWALRGLKGGTARDHHHLSRPSLPGGTSGAIVSRRKMMS